MINILAASTPHQQMRAFDSLPQPLRIAIAGADFAYDPRLIAACISEGLSPEKIQRGIERYERKLK